MNKIKSILAGLALISALSVAPALSNNSEEAATVTTPSNTYLISSDPGGGVGH
jgi:hypothetical protein